MSSYYQLELCKDCGVMTNHIWHDNMSMLHKYTVECGKCGLKTPEEYFAKLTNGEA